MTIRQKGGVFGRNPSFNTIELKSGSFLLSGNSINGKSVSIENDAVATFSFARYGGFIFVTCNGNDSFPLGQNSAALFADWGGSAGQINYLYQGPSFEGNSGATIPTGTTGVDGKVTIFVGGDDDVFYLENRTGGTRDFQVAIF